MVDFSKLFDGERLADKIRDRRYEPALKAAAFDQAESELEMLFSLQLQYYDERIQSLGDTQAALARVVATRPSLSNEQRAVLKDQIAAAGVEANKLREESTGLHDAYRKAVAAIQDAVVS